MKVAIKSLQVQMDVKKNGVEFQVHANDGTHLGDCIVTKTGVIWCDGKTTREKGRKVNWKEFIAKMREP